MPEQKPRKISLDELADDVPLGAIGRAFGFQVISPKLKAGETILWSARSNMMQWRVRAVGGRLYLTDQRLVFGRSRIESLLGGREWSVELCGIAYVSHGGKRRLSVKQRSGQIDWFLLKAPEEAACLADRAIQGLIFDHQN